MTDEYLALALILAGAVCLFWTGKLRTDLVALLVVLALIIPWPHGDGTWRGILTYKEGFSGFGSTAVIMVVAMFIFGAAMVRTGMVEYFGGRLFKACAHHEAVAIIFAPIAYRVSLEAGMDPKPFLVALALCVSAGFSTPVAHESTILVSGPGRYQFKH